MKTLQTIATRALSATLKQGTESGPEGAAVLGEEELRGHRRAEGQYNASNIFQTITSPCAPADKFSLRYFQGSRFPSSLVKLDDSEQTVHTGISQHVAKFFFFSAGSRGVHQGISLQPETLFKTTVCSHCVLVSRPQGKSQDRKFLCLSAGCHEKSRTG